MRGVPDSGTNQSVTNNIDLLHDIRFIVPHQMGGIGSGITCTTIGIYYLTIDDGAIIKVPMFYSADYQETVLSPHDVCDSNKNFTIFRQQGNTDTGEESLMFQSKTGLIKAQIPLQQHNQLWFIEQDSQALAIHNKIYNMPSDIIHSMSGTALHDLWHNQLCHTSQDAIKDIHKHCEGVPNLKSKTLYFIATAAIQILRKRFMDTTNTKHVQNAKMNVSILILDSSNHLI